MPWINETITSIYEPITGFSGFVSTTINTSTIESFWIRPNCSEVRLYSASLDEPPIEVTVFDPLSLQEILSARGSVNVIIEGTKLIPKNGYSFHFQGFIKLETL